MNNLVKVRKYVGMVDETLHDGGPDLTKSVRKAVVGGVVANPFAGRYVEDLRPMVQALEPLRQAFGLKRVIVSTYQAASGVQDRQFAVAAALGERPL